MKKYVVDVEKVTKDFYTGVATSTWKRRKEVCETREEAIAIAKKCRNAWAVVECVVDVNTMKIKEKIVADHINN